MAPLPLSLSDLHIDGVILASQLGLLQVVGRVPRLGDGLSHAALTQCPASGSSCCHCRETSVCIFTAGSGLAGGRQQCVSVSLSVVVTVWPLPAPLSAPLKGQLGSTAGTAGPLLSPEGVMSLYRLVVITSKYKHYTFCTD